MDISGIAATRKKIHFVQIFLNDRKQRNDNVGKPALRDGMSMMNHI